MKLTLYPNGYEHFLQLWFENKGIRPMDETAMYSDAVGHLESKVSCDDELYQDLLVLKDGGKNNTTYVVCRSEANPDLNAVYLVNEDDDGLPPSAHELACEKAACDILTSWKAEDVILSIKELIAFGWAGFANKEDKPVVTLENKVAGKLFVTNHEVNINTRVSIHKRKDNSWGVVMATGRHHEHIILDQTMSNDSQTVFWDKAYWFLQRIFGDAEVLATLDMVRSIFGWVTEVVSRHVTDALESGAITAEHHYITASCDPEGGKPLIRILWKNDVIKVPTPEELSGFLSIFPNTVVYPSNACSAWEREFSYPLRAKSGTWQINA